MPRESPPVVRPGLEPGGLMSLFWGRYNDWTPEGGHRKPWRDLEPGDLIEADRKPWRVVEVRDVPVADWEDQDHEYFKQQQRRSKLMPLPGSIPSEEEWELRPLYLIVVPVAGGKRHHQRLRPYGPFRHGAWVLSPHYPVCKDCGELWPCREVEITREVDRQSAKLAKFEKILPGCCWSCGDPVTHKQSSIRFDGENLLLPGAPSPVFHLRRQGDCRSAAASYEKRWISAEEGRRWRLQCPGKQIRHVDGEECTEDPLCPGRVSHNAFTSHVYGKLPDGTFQSAYGPDFRCLRCEDALERRDLAIGEPPPDALL